MSLAGKLLPARVTSGLVLAALAWAGGSVRAKVQEPPAAQSAPAQARAKAEAAVRAAAASGQSFQALDAYDRYYATAKAHDAGLIALLAKGALTAAAADRASPAHVPALERLARSGDASARAQLESEASGDSTLMRGGIVADCALARLGDSRAVDRLIYRIEDESPADKGMMLNGLAEAGAKRAAYAVVPLLGDANPSNRLAAVRALAKIGAPEHIASLTAAFEAESRAFVRQFIAMALRALGGSAGDALLAEMERASSDESRLLALEAYHASKSPKWPALAHELLRSPDEGPRLKAAVLLGLADADARQALAAAAKSTNVATRELAVMALESAGSRDTSLLLSLLRDPSPVVRTYAAGALLAANR